MGHQYEAEYAEYCDRYPQSKLSHKLFAKFMQNYRKQNRLLSLSLGSRIRTAIKKGKKCSRTMDLVGCSIEELRKHLELQFQQGMNWYNHGIFGWHIDHILPCSSFDLNDPIQQKECFHYSNLQPLWAKDNMQKRAKLDWRKKE
jgi:hypothetical protein